MPTQLLRQLGLDKRWQVACAVALLLGIAAASSIGPLVRYVATSRATALGLELDIGAVRPGWFSVRLKDSDVRLSGVDALKVHLDQITVDVSPWLQVSNVEVAGGLIELNGPSRALLEQLQAWRDRRGGAEASAAPADRPRTPVRATNLVLNWVELEPGAPAQVVTGLHLERTSDALRAGFGELKLALSAGRVSAGNAVAVFDNQTRALRSLDVGRLLGRLELGADRAERDSAVQLPELKPEPGLEPAPPRAGAAADVEPDDVGAAPVAGASGAGLGRWLAPLTAGTWVQRNAQLHELRKLIAARLSDGARIDVAELQLGLARGQEVLNIGPAPFHVELRAGELSAAFTSPRDEQGKALAFTLRLPLQPGVVELNLEGGPINLQTLGMREGDFGLLGVDRSLLTMATRVQLSTEGVLTLDASGELAQLSLEHASLAPEPLRDVHLTWGGNVRFDLDQRKLDIKDGVLGLMRVRVLLNAELEASDTDLRVALDVQIPKTPCHDLLEAAPYGLLPMLEGLQLGGTFALNSRVSFDTRTPKEPAVEWNFDNRCQVKSTPEAIDPQRFREPFQHLVTDAAGNPVELATGPTTEHWVPLSEIPKHMETALIVCEDSRFFTHRGFDNKAIRDSIADNLRAGRFVRGASTLSMQLAKNLYLRREKTLSRKLQEAAFTLLLEERLSKQDILELYLNVVEFAPGVYGIRNAAAHYFNAHPGELSLGQALFLGSILPRPKGNHFAQDGSLRPRWAEHLQYLMRIAHKIHRITDEELAAGLNERIVFGEPHPTTDGDFLFGTPLFDMGGR